MHQKKPPQPTKEAKPDYLWAHFQRRMCSYHHALVTSNPIPLQPLFGLDSHFKEIEQVDRVLQHVDATTVLYKIWHNSCLQPPMPLTWPACHYGIVACWAGQHVLIRPASGYVGFCSASREKAIQAHPVRARNKTHKAEAHGASLAQLHPETFAMVLLVLFTTDLL